MKNQPTKKGTLVDFHITSDHPYTGRVVGYHFERGVCLLHVEHRGTIWEIPAKSCMKV